MRRSTATELRHAKKRLRRHEIQEERLSERLERQQQLEKENRDRAVRAWPAGRALLTRA